MISSLVLYPEISWQFPVILTGDGSAEEAVLAPLMSLILCVQGTVPSTLCLFILSFIHIELDTVFTRFYRGRNWGQERQVCFSNVTASKTWIETMTCSLSCQIANTGFVRILTFNTNLLPIICYWSSFRPVIPWNYAHILVNGCVYFPDSFPRRKGKLPSSTCLWLKIWVEGLRDCSMDKGACSQAWVLNLILKIYMVEENGLLKVVLWPLWHTCPSHKCFLKKKLSEVIGHSDWQELEGSWQL